MPYLIEPPSPSPSPPSSLPSSNHLSINDHHPINDCHSGYEMEMESQAYFDDYLLRTMGQRYDSVELPTQLHHPGFGQVLSPIDPYGGRFAMPSSTSSAGSPYSVNSAYASIHGKRKSGGRRPKEEEELNLSKDEMDKRRIRRIRNKEAAARCRQRRLDQMDDLQQKVNVLDEEIRDRDEQIQQLMGEKQELEYLLRSHNCPNGAKLLLKSLSNSNQNFAAVTSAQGTMGRQESIVKQEPTLTQVVTQSMDSIMTSDSHMRSDIQRPDTLGLGLDFSAAGLSMNTPSSGLIPGGGTFDLMGMPTGLTPITSQALNGFTPVSITPSTSAAALETPTIMRTL